MQDYNFTPDERQDVTKPEWQGLAFHPIAIPDEQQNGAKQEWFMVVLFYVLLLSAVFKNGEFNQRAFGAAPLGLPTWAFVTSLLTIIYIPYIWIVRHFTRVVRQAVSDRAIVTRWGILIYLLSASKRHPRLKHSVAWCAYGIAYSLALLIAWIWYVESKHI